MAEDPHKNKANFKEDHVRQRIRRNIIDAGFPSAKVDEVMSNVHNLPETLVQAYYNMVRDDIKTRIQSDEDYQEKKNEPKKPYEYLDKI
jgi:hypothetical protein